MSPEQKQGRKAILDADDDNHYAVVEWLSRSYVQDFPDDAMIWVRRGRILTMLCRYAEADAAFEAALEYANDELMPLVWSYKGESFVRRGHFAEAEHCFRNKNIKN